MAETPSSSNPAATPIGAAAPTAGPKPAVLPDLVVFKNVTKKFGEGPEAKVAIQDVTFTVEDLPNAGELVTIVGPSGCGKSTILRIIAGLAPHFPPTSGEAHVFGKPVAGGQAHITGASYDVERRQVAATKVGSTFSFLSTEVVKYSSAAAASAAQKELVKVLAQCQTEKGYKDATGTLLPYEFKTLKSIPTGVVSEGNRVFVHTVIDSGVRARTLLGFYQFNGDTFTGLYVMNADGYSDAQVAKWLKVAVTMAQRLQGKNA